MITRKKIFRNILVFILILFMIMPLMRYFSMNSSIMDLGLFLNNIYNVNYEQYRAISGHFQPIMYLFGVSTNNLEPYLLPYIILFVQSSIFIISALILSKYYGDIYALIFCIYPLTWNALIFDFHFDSLIILIDIIFFTLVRYGYIKIALLIGVSCFFIKEPYILRPAFYGLFLISICKIEINKIKIYVYAYILLSFITFIVVAKYINTLFVVDDQAIFGNTAFNWIFNLSKINIISELEVNKGAIVQKIKYLAIIFFPLILVCRYFPYPLIVAFPYVLIGILSSNPSYYDYTAHYGIGVVIPIIISYYYGINKYYENEKRL